MWGIRRHAVRLMNVFLSLNMVMVVWSGLAEGLNMVTRSKPSISQLAKNFGNTICNENEVRQLLKETMSPETLKFNKYNSNLVTFFSFPYNLTVFITTTITTSTVIILIITTIIIHTNNTAIIYWALFCVQYVLYVDQTVLLRTILWDLCYYHFLTQKLSDKWFNYLVQDHISSKKIQNTKGTQPLTGIMLL
jgi:hypothetical protein